MQIYFNKEEMGKNIEFTKKLYSMDDLEGYQVFFEKFLKNKWQRKTDKRMNLEKFVDLMENCDMFVSKLFIGEDCYIPFRYAVNAADKKKDKLLEIHCDLNDKNFSRVQELYSNIYGKEIPGVDLGFCDINSKK